MHEGLERFPNCDCNKIPCCSDRVVATAVDTMAGTTTPKKWNEPQDQLRGGRCLVIPSLEHGQERILLKTHKGEQRVEKLAENLNRVPPPTS